MGEAAAAKAACSKSARKADPAAGIATAAAASPRLLQLCFVKTRVSGIGLWFFSVRSEMFSVKSCVSQGCGEGVGLPLSGATRR